LRAPVERQQSAESQPYQAVARISAVRRLWAGLVFDELDLIAWPLSLGALGVAVVVFVRVAPSP
jgi:hypothetical protein